MGNMDLSSIPYLSTSGPGSDHLPYLTSGDFSKSLDSYLDNDPKTSCSIFIPSHFTVYCICNVVTYQFNLLLSRYYLAGPVSILFPRVNMFNFPHLSHSHSVVFRVCRYLVDVK